MKRIIPDDIYRGLPCSTVAVGCALGITGTAPLEALVSGSLKADGYLSLKGMNALIRANLAVKRRTDFKQGKRPLLREYAHTHSAPAIICVTGHFLYYDGKDYWSFFYNGGDEVVSVWELN